jgi:hypothetical protein
MLKDISVIPYYISDSHDESRMKNLLSMDLTGHCLIIFLFDGFTEINDNDKDYNTYKKDIMTATEFALKSKALRPPNIILKLNKYWETESFANTRQSYKLVLQTVQKLRAMHKNAKIDYIVIPATLGFPFNKRYFA